MGVIAETIGRVEFLVGLDGSRLPAEARQLGKTIGKEGDKAGKEFGESFEAALGPQLSKMAKSISGKLSQGGQLAGTKLADDFAATARKRLQQKKFDVTEALFDQHGFDNLVTRFGDVDSAVEHLRTTLAALNKENIFDKDGTWKGLVVTKKEMESLNSTIDEFADNLRNRLTPAVEKADEEFEVVEKRTSRLRTAMDKLTDGVTRQGSAWKSLSANTRQWTLIVGAVIGAMGQLAGLGSAAGSGLFVLAGALSSVVTGLGLTIAAFVSFTKPVEDLPEILQPARRALTDFGDAFSEVGEAMAVAAFAKTTQAWKTLAATVRGMRGPLEKVGGIIGDLVNDLAKNLAPGTDAFKDLAYFIEQSGVIFDRVARMAGRLGDALLDAFANPNMQRSIDELIGWMEDLFDTFAEFLRGPGFDEWLNHGRDIFGAFGRLLATTGDLLNDLVTDETVEMLVEFIDNIEGFLDGGGRDLLEFATQLDIFGLIAKALNDFGKALEPLAGPMEDFATALNDVIESGIDTLAPIIEDVATALAPFVQAIADFMKENPKAVADALLLIGAAFAVLKLAKIATVAADALLFSTAIGAGGAAIKKFDTGKLKKIGTGLAGIGAIAATQLIPDEFWDQFDLESNIGQDILTGAAWGLMFGGWGALIGAGIAMIIGLFTDFEKSFNDIGTGLSASILGGPLGGIQGQLLNWFTSLIPEEWQTSDNPFERAMAQLADPIADPGTFITNLPAMYEQAFAEIGAVLGQVGVEWNNFWASLPAAWENFWALLNTPEFWFAIADSIGQFVAQMIDEFGNFIEDVRTNWSNFWAVLPLVVAAAWNNLIAGFQGWWARLSAGFLTWYSGVKANWERFWNGLGAKPEQTFTDAWAAVQSGFTRIKNIFAVVGGQISSTWTNFWNGLVRTVTGVVNTIIGVVQRLFGPIGDALARLGGLNAPNGRAMASGGILHSPTNIYAGEAGSEAIVPLNRALSQVSPDVRWLSAIAQGKGAPQQMFGGGIGGGRSVTFQPGSIVVQGSLDPARTALTVANRVSERVAG